MSSMRRALRSPFRSRMRCRHSVMTVPRASREPRAASQPMQAQRCVARNPARRCSARLLRLARAPWCSAQSSRASASSCARGRSGWAAARAMPAARALQCSVGDEKSHSSADTASSGGTSAARRAFGAGCTLWLQPGMLSCGETGKTRETCPPRPSLSRFCSQ